MCVQGEQEVCLPREMVIAYAKEAKRLGCTRNELIRNALKGFIEQMAREYGGFRE